MNTEISGVYPVLPTPFDDNGAPDPHALCSLVDFATTAGASGLVYPGFASEVDDLRTAERHELLAVVAKEAGSTVPIVAGASANSPDEVVSHTLRAMDLGIMHVMIQPPGSLGRKAGPIAEFLNEVVDAAPAVRIILQNAPAPRGVQLGATSILGIAREVNNIAYVKEESIPSGPAITAMKEDPARPGNLAGIIGGGGSRYVLDEYARGACASMPAIELTDLHVAIDDAWREGRQTEAQEIYAATLPLLTMQAAYRMRLTKFVMMRRGILVNSHVRAPMPELDEIAIAGIDAALADLQRLPSYRSDEQFQHV